MSVFLFIVCLILIIGWVGSYTTLNDRVIALKNHNSNFRKVIVDLRKEISDLEENIKYLENENPAKIIIVEDEKETNKPIVNEKAYSEKEYNDLRYDFWLTNSKLIDKMQKLESSYKAYIKKLRKSINHEVKEGFETERTFSFYLSETDVGHRTSQIRKRCEEGDEVKMVTKNNKKSIDENYAFAYCHDRPIGTVPPEILYDILFFILFDNYHAYIEYIGQDEFGYQVRIAFSYNYKFYE